jgi:hypothetical protein
VVQRAAAPLADRGNNGGGFGKVFGLVGNAGHESLSEFKFIIPNRSKKAAKILPFHGKADSSLRSE